MGNRKSNNANRAQHGNWHERFLKDGVFPRGRRKKKKNKVTEPKKRQKKIYKTKDFCHHQESARLSKGISKVQIEGLKIFIDEAQKENKNSIKLCFKLKESTISWLKDNKYKLINFNKSNRKAVIDASKEETFIGW